MPAKDTSKADATKLGGRTAWYALFLVTLTIAMSLVDRQILAILAPCIKSDLNIGDASLFFHCLPATCWHLSTLAHR